MSTEDCPASSVVYEMQELLAELPGMIASLNRNGSHLLHFEQEDSRLGWMANGLE